MRLDECKPGSMVVCTEGCGSGPYALLNGKVYEINSVGHEHIWVVSEDGRCSGGWLPFRFSPAAVSVKQEDFTVTIRDKGLPTETRVEQLYSLPTDSAVRKNIPMASGLLDYFPAALAEVAFVSYVGNQKHNPGEPLHHARGKSMDHADCIVRHLVDRGTVEVVTIGGETYTMRHSAYVARRALALLQEEMEAAGAPLARGARVVIEGKKEARIDVVKARRELEEASETGCRF